MARVTTGGTIGDVLKRTGERLPNLALTLADLQRRGQQDERQSLLDKESRELTAGREKRSERLLGIKEAGDRRAQQLFDIQNPVGPVQPEPLSLEDIKNRAASEAFEAGGLEGVLNVVGRFREAEKGPEKVKKPTVSPADQPLTPIQRTAQTEDIFEQQRELFPTKHGFFNLEMLKARATGVDKDASPEEVEEAKQLLQQFSGIGGPSHAAAFEAADSLSILRPSLQRGLGGQEQQFEFTPEQIAAEQARRAAERGQQ